MTQSKELIGLLGQRATSPEALLVLEPFEPFEHTSEGDRRYLEAKHSGIAVGIGESGRVEIAFFYGGQREGFARYEGILPLDVRMSWDRSQVQAALGLPSRSGGGEDVPFFGKAAPWDRYDFPSFSLHLEYGPGEDDPIELATLSSRLATPGLES